MSEQEQQAQDALEQLGTVDSYQEAMEAFLKEFSENFDPLDFMPPSQREIMRMPADQFQAEYELVVKKESSRSAAQRKYIIERYEQEQNATRDAADQQDSSNA
jgi:hypothetical protein